MPRNIKKQCQAHKIEKSRFRSSFYRNPSYSADQRNNSWFLRGKIWFLVFSDSGNRFGHMREVRPEILRSLAQVWKNVFFFACLEQIRCILPKASEAAHISGRPVFLKTEILLSRQLRRGKLNILYHDCTIEKLEAAVRIITTERKMASNAGPSFQWALGTILYRAGSKRLILFKLVTKTYKFQIGHFPCFRIDCRRRKTTMRNWTVLCNMSTSTVQMGFSCKFYDSFIFTNQTSQKADERSHSGKVWSFSVEYSDSMHPWV